MKQVHTMSLVVFRTLNCGLRNVYTGSKINQYVKTISCLKSSYSPSLKEQDGVNKTAADIAANKRKKCDSEHVQEQIELDLFGSQHQLKNDHVQDRRHKGNKFRSFGGNRKKTSKYSELKESRVSRLDINTSDELKFYNNINREPIELYDNDLHLKYFKLYRYDPLYKNLKLLIMSRKRRDVKNKIILEGKRLIVDALDAGLSADYLLCNHLCILDGIRLSKTTKLVKTQSNLLQELSGLVTCPGIIGIFNKPHNVSEMMANRGSSHSLPITVVCDNIREPNNLGSVIRSCAAVSVDSIVLLKGCTFPWEPKCLRGGTGAHFRANIFGPLAIDELAKFIPPNASFLIADNKNNGKDENFVFCEYDAANYCEMNHMVLVIGGEAHGVSSDVRRFIRNFSGDTEVSQNANYKIHIPLQNGIESFNTASALSVILCEIRRQIKRVKEPV